VFSVVLLMAALGGWDSGCSSPDFGGPPMMPMATPVFVQPPVVQQPPIVDGKATGKLLRVEIEHADGSRWFYTFAAPPEVVLTLDASNHNAAVNLAQAGVPKLEDQPLVTQKPNFGIDEKEMAKRKGRNRYTIEGGVEITKSDANRLFRGDGELPNDAGYDMLAVIGSQEDCEKVRKDVDTDPAFAPLRDKLLVQCYRPDDEMVKRKGFVPGNPSIYLQDSTGKTKWREVEYRGPKVLAGEIDKRRPDYDPNKDPGPHNPPPSPILPTMPNIDLSKVPGWVWAVLAFFGFSFMQRKPA
jgi:hypothetical protein